MVKIKRQPVQVNEATVLRLREYSDTTSVPIARVVDRAITEFLDRNATAHMRALAPVVARIKVKHPKPSKSVVARVKVTHK